MHFVTLYIDGRIDGADNPTTAKLAELGVVHEIVDVRSAFWYPDTFCDVLRHRRLGELPVLVSTAGAWSGHRPDLIEAVLRLRIFDPHARIVQKGGREIRSRNGRRVIARLKFTERDPNGAAARYSLRDALMRAYFERTRGLPKPSRLS